MASGVVHKHSVNGVVTEYEFHTQGIKCCMKAGTKFVNCMEMIDAGWDRGQGVLEEVSHLVWEKD